MIGDDEARAKAEQRALHRRERLDNDLRAIMSRPEGRRFVCRLIDEICGVSSGSFSNDKAEMAFIAGRRDVGITLMREAQRVAPAEYVHLLVERTSDRNDGQGNG